MFVASIASHNQMVEAEQYLHMRIYCMQQLLFPPNVTTVLKCIKHMRTKQDTCQMSLFLCCIAGRRNNISLENILQFVTAMDEEPVLGYAKQPSIAFTEVQSSFFMESHDCLKWSIFSICSGFVIICSGFVIIYCAFVIICGCTELVPAH